jgi:glycosyltransferase involved in cell wall biosynthesis
MVSESVEVFASRYPDGRPTVSVVIPTYNCEGYIADTISSVLGQTFGDLELIVVDDGSSDRTAELAGAYGPPVRIVHQSNAGVCAARNRGIREAAGRYICLLDHDDYWFPAKLRQQVEVMESDPGCGVVYTSFIRWYPDAAGVFPAPETFEMSDDAQGIESESSGWIYHLLLLDCWILTSTAMFRRELFDRCGFFDESLAYSEDWDLWLRISRKYPFIKLKNQLALYRQYPEQGSAWIRDRDYRTILLEKAVRTWGYCSPDGHCLPPRQFKRQLSEYHAKFALQQLVGGHRSRSIQSFAKAWAADPANFRRMAYLLAATFGWRPNAV